MKSTRPRRMRNHGGYRQRWSGGPRVNPDFDGILNVPLLCGIIISTWKKWVPVTVGLIYSAHIMFVIHLSLVLTGTSLTDGPLRSVDIIYGFGSVGIVLIALLSASIWSWRQEKNGLLQKTTTFGPALMAFFTLCSVASGVLVMVIDSGWFRLAWFAVTCGVSTYYVWLLIRDIDVRDLWSQFKS